MLYQRTTLRLNQDIYKQAKKRAVDQDINLQDLINQALKSYLNIADKTKKNANLDLAEFDIGKTKGKIDRKAIYGQKSQVNFT